MRLGPGGGQAGDSRADIDAAHHAKYDSDGPAIVGTIVGTVVGTVVGPEAQDVTIRLLPRRA
ncbi:hypothetical protein ACVBEQ_08405 [Nakamurella sp. GG22]